MKKIFTLLTLALVSIGTWATPTTIFDANASDWSSATLTSGTTTVGDVSWYGRGSAAIASDDHDFADGKNFKKALRLGGKSTYKSGSNLAGVFTYTPANDGILKVYAKGSGKSSRHVYVTQTAATSTENDASIAIASATSGDGDNALFVIVEAFVEASKQVAVYCDADNYIYGMTFEATNSDLALSSTSGVTGVSASTSFTYTTSSTGTVTVGSSDEAVATATVNTATNTVTVTGVAAGTATITVTQAADASYGKGVKRFTVTVNTSLSLSATFLVPAGTLDLSDADAASAMLNDTWTPDRPYFGNNGTSNYITFTVNSAFRSKANQTWVQVPTSGDNTGASTGEAWSATGVFKGSGSYSTTNAATGQSGRTYTFYSFRVKGVSKVQVLVKGSAANAATLAAFEMTGDTPAGTTLNYMKCTGTSVSTLELTLDKTKEYLVTVNNALNTSNSRFYEMALFYDESVICTIPATIDDTYGWATFVNKYAALDFSSVSTLKAYIVTGESGDAITKTQMTATVPAGTPLLLNGATSSIPVAASSTTDVSANKLKAGTGNPVEKPASGSAWVLSDYIDAAVFKYIDANAATVPVGKAYLLLASDTPTESRTLALDGEATAIKNIKVGTEDNIYYDLNGRRVLYPTKGLYIVNGKKVILK